MKNIFYFNTRNKFPMKYENKFFDLAQGQGFQKNVRLKQKQENKCRFSRFATIKVLFLILVLSICHAEGQYRNQHNLMKK